MVFGKVLHSFWSRENGTRKHCCTGEFIFQSRRISILLRQNISTWTVLCFSLCLPPLSYESMNMNIFMIFFYNVSGRLELTQSKIILSFQSINTVMFRIFYFFLFFSFFQLESLEQETIQWCREILRNSPTAIRVLKSALNAVDDGHAGLQVLQISNHQVSAIVLSSILELEGQFVFAC